jgi:hypothetical protein
MSEQRSYRATALLGVALAAVVAAVFVFGDPTANAPATRPAAPTPAELAAEAEAEAPPPTASAAQSAAAPADFAGVDVQLSRVAEGREPERLASPATTRIGDRLRIGISSDRELHVYAFNQELGGAPTVMFPLAVLDTRNPLPAGEHELPGTVQGEYQSYTVESRAPSEEVLLVLSTAAIPALESRLLELAALTDGAAAGGSPRLSLDQLATEAGVEAAVHRWVLEHAAETAPQ